MNLYITDFVPSGNEDASLKYELDVSPVFEQTIVSLLEHKNLNEMASGEWLLTTNQVKQIAALINEPIPLDLDVFIGVQA